MAAGPAAACLLELRVRIPPGARMSVCIVFTATELYDWQIPRAQQSYRKVCVYVKGGFVTVCDQIRQ